MDRGTSHSLGREYFFFPIFRKILSRLPIDRRRKFWLFLGIMVVVAIFETVATASIAFLASTMASPETVLHSKYVGLIQHIFQVKLFDSIQEIIVFVSFIVMCLVGMKNGLQLMVIYYTTRFAYTVDEYFGALLFNGILRMPYEWHLTRNSADLVLAVQWRIFVGSNFINASFQILSDILVVSFLLLAIFLVQPFVSMIMVTVVGISGFLIYKSMNHLQEKAADKCRKYDRSINREVTKGIHGIKDVKISGRYKTFINSFKIDANPLSLYRGQQGIFRRAPVGLLETLGFVLLSATIYSMLYFGESSTAKITGTITLVAVVAWRVLPAINRILGGFAAIRSILPYTKDVMKYIEEIEANANYDISIDRNATKDINYDSDIQMDNVSFTYGDAKEKVIKDVSFKIKKGQLVGIIGRSGAGKSTIVDILVGLLAPTMGRVLIDGEELTGDSKTTWINKVGYVPQSPYIFDGSLAENVAFGYNTSEIDKALVIDSCKKANMQDFLEELPQSIDTKIGERGVRLSGGQQQRVAIARALYSKSEVIVFDEATSSLDTRSEKSIQNTINNLKGKQTLIIIAHRLSTIRDCDLLVWVEKGTISGNGAVSEVLKEYGKTLAS